MRKQIWSLVAGSLLLLSQAGEASAELLGYQPNSPLTGFNSTGKTTFTGATGLLHITAQPLQTNFVVKGTVYNIGTPRSLEINLLLDPSGNIKADYPGDDFVMTGTIDENGDGIPEYSGVLLTGEIMKLGYLDANIWPLVIDLFDFRFRLTGGVFAPLYGTNDIYVNLTVEDSTFNNTFASDFQGGAKGWVTPAPPPLRQRRNRRRRRV